MAAGAVVDGEVDGEVVGEPDGEVDGTEVVGDSVGDLNRKDEIERMYAMRTRRSYGDNSMPNRNSM